MYYLQNRYYDPTTCRFLNADAYASTGQGMLGNNMFAYCLNNPVMFEDPTGRSSSILEGIGDALAGLIESIIENLREALTVKYEVPLYKQGRREMCWAYCQLMIEDYHAGVKRTQSDADNQAKELSIRVFREEEASGKIILEGEDFWNHGHWPTNSSRAVESQFNILQLFLFLQDGPIYGYYWSGKKGDGAHLVVITGVDILGGKIYTNNPWGIKGEQTFSEFLNGVAGASDSIKMPFFSLGLVP